MMRKILMFIAFICLVTGVKAQFRTDKLTFGGGLGMQFGNYTLINIAPQVGYNFSNYLNAGAGFTFTHYSDKYDNNQWKQTNNYLGFNVYGRLYPLPYVVLSVQPEINRMWRSNTYRPTGDKTKEEEMIPSFLVGAGVRVGPMRLMIQYDVAKNENSPYGNKIFYSVGYSFNL
ncbi:hypothetical protein [Parabacteroides sp. PF5-9]|uniref:hypothetical protein n=1 Tax=Parabacteroides sp. PF5-9 TaxID=1742404 RepID=UPI002474775B|nr:hypothetical protein [Parabacteroides sp. PF5-9]MDH6358390.1 hypothetical protein [Parabacteroides sp. PF5-9]